MLILLHLLEHEIVDTRHENAAARTSMANARCLRAAQVQARGVVWSRAPSGAGTSAAAVKSSALPRSDAVAGSNDSNSANVARGRRAIAS